MREALNQWLFVYGAYGVGIVSTAVLVWWSWFDMRRAEKRREETRGK